MTATSPANDQTVLLDRYFLFREIAAGGMASIHLARLLGPVGFGRTVAIKRLHPQFAKERAFVTMFVDEARIVTAIRHPNVVPVLDVVANPGLLLLVMEYVHGEALHRLAVASIEARRPIPAPIVSAIGIHVLDGLHAAHEALGPGGKPLGIIHRDVSPQNVLVGTDGLARVLDFGIARATGRMGSTSEGELKGKIAYMAPEQIDGESLDRRVDVWSAGVTLWELLTLQRLFRADNEGGVMRRVLEMSIPPPSHVASSAAPALDAVVMKALQRRPDERWPDARAMALALEAACPPARPRDVSEWVESLAGGVLREREKLLEELEHIVTAGLPSIGTQLKVIADRAPPVTTGTDPSRPALRPDDATAAVGGRPPEPPGRAGSATVDIPVSVGFAGESGVSVTVLPRKRFPIAAAVGAAFVVTAAVAAGAVYTRRTSATAPPAPTASVTEPAPARSEPPPIPSGTPAAAHPATSASAPAVASGKPTPSTRKPVRSDRAPDPDGIRLDHRK